jgi:hypothetical protein
LDCNQPCLLSHICLSCWLPWNLRMTLAWIYFAR